MGFTQSGWAAVEIGLTLTVNVVAIIGNMLVVLAVYRNKKLRTSTNLLVLNLALADGFTALFCIPLTASAVLGDRWGAGPVLCSVQGFLMFVLGSVSIHTVTITAINRYCRILQPNFYRKWITYKGTLIFLALMWIFLLCAVLVAKVSGCAEISYRPSTASCVLRYSKTPEGRAALGLTVVFGFLYPTATMTFCYFKVFQVIRKHNSQTEPLRRRSNSLHIRETKHSKPTYSRFRSQRRVLAEETSVRPEKCHGRQIRIAGNTANAADIKFDNLPGAEIQTAGRANIANEGDDKLALGTETGETKRRNCSADCFTSEALKETERSRTRCDILESAVPQNARDGGYAGIEKASHTTKRELERTRTNRTENIKVEQAPRLRSNVEEIRITRILFAVLMGFVLCWLPTAVIGLLTYTPHGRSVPEFVRFLSVWVVYLSCCLNVFIYGIMSKPFRRDILKMICCSR